MEVNMESILDSVKKLIGPSVTYSVFDPDLIMHINTAFFNLYQLGVTDTPFVITDENDTWEDFHSDTDLESVKTYVGLKTRMYFDPPTNSALISAINEQIKELEWRLNVAVDPKN
jgi:hypothetical protein